MSNEQFIRRFKGITRDSVSAGEADPSVQEANSAPNNTGQEGLGKKCQFGKHEREVLETAVPDRLVDIMSQSRDRIERIENVSMGEETRFIYREHSRDAGMESHHVVGYTSNGDTIDVWQPSDFPDRMLLHEDAYRANEDTIRSVRIQHYHVCKEGNVDEIDYIGVEIVIGADKPIQWVVGQGQRASKLKGFRGAVENSDLGLDELGGIMASVVESGWYKYRQGVGANKTEKTLRNSPDRQHKVSTRQIIYPEVESDQERYWRDRQRQDDEYHTWVARQLEEEKQRAAQALDYEDLKRKVTEEERARFSGETGPYRGDDQGYRCDYIEIFPNEVPGCL